MITDNQPVLNLRHPAATLSDLLSGARYLTLNSYCSCYDIKLSPEHVPRVADLL
jgi:hypothetical protein